ncbi:hypothetical protein THAOC_11330 [Thalassiosira oceanica]|uniref:Cyclic nucleotide-binding domain-containing protein n=1 Tax=Thalassiosira oceanica TaxID=159749 RepID=K0SRL4_THAOC|nr:hypothetical protein THAOC_11330 [Thalassiosira oceanica]|eukprot:EJK67614.1 hypothetical protein THAOC_11330 [Thalassiosira oceanica]
MDEFRMDRATTTPSARIALDLDRDEGRDNIPADSQTSLPRDEGRPPIYPLHNDQSDEPDNMGMLLQQYCSDHNVEVDFNPKAKVLNPNSGECLVCFLFWVACCPGVSGRTGLLPLSYAQCFYVLSSSMTATCFMMLPMNPVEVLKLSIQQDDDISSLTPASLIDKMRQLICDDATVPGILSTGMKSKKSNCQAIQGGPVDDVKDDVPPNVPKFDSARALIYKAIKPNVLFRTCDEDELSDFIDSFQPITHTKGIIVIREGDDADDGFYVLSKGSVSVCEQTEYKVTLSPGSGFGEIALLYSCPRTASIKAKEDCELWVMDRRAFRVILSRHKKKGLNMKLMQLEKVKIHDKLLSEILKPNEMQSVAMAAKFQLFNAQEIIVTQGEKGDAFYMILDGLVDVYIAQKNNGMPVVSLKEGAFFGEKALLSSDVQTATCVAQNNVKCLVLGREDFVRTLGDLEYLKNRNYKEMEDEVMGQG